MFVFHTKDCLEIKHQSEMKVLDTQSCLTLCNPMDCNPPDSSVEEIL